MKIPAPLVPSVEAAKPDPLGLLKMIKPGQLLQAKVAEATSPQGLAKLLIGNTRLLAKTRIALQQGEALSLRVEKGLPKPELKILQNLAEKPVQTLLRGAMLRQLAPKEVQQALRQLQPPTQPPASTGGKQALPQQQPVPNDRAQAPAQIIKTLRGSPTPVQQISAQAVKQSLQHSGLFYEANLAAGKIIPQDQKLQLLQLLRLFTPSARSAQPSAAKGEPQNADARPQTTDQLMNRLLRLVEGSLARVQANQAQSLAAEEPGRQVWQFDMPIQLLDRQQQLAIRVQHDQANADEEGSRAGTWKVDIEFDFDKLGNIYSRINLAGEEISAAFWAERDSTAATIERALPKLEAALSQAGLSVKAVSSLHGEPPRPAAASSRLLDERA